MEPTYKTQVFISCGQRHDSKEVEIANKIGDAIKELGFEPYVAIGDQSIKTVRNNIFYNLEISDYFIFVDLETRKIAYWRIQRFIIFPSGDLQYYISRKRNYCFSGRGCKER